MFYILLQILFQHGNLLFFPVLSFQKSAGTGKGFDAIAGIVAYGSLTKGHGLHQHALCLEAHHRHTLSAAAALGLELGGVEDKDPVITCKGLY